jgi:EAL domain-containing protein (putative c-di-GMP-specific phosphodiesterase class I)
VNSTIGLSKQLGLSVIAEGIENRASVDLLLSMGCDEGQGYFFGKPMPVGDFEAKYKLFECIAPRSPRTKSSALVAQA